VERVAGIVSAPPAAYQIWKELVVTHVVKGVQVHDARIAALMQAQDITHLLTLNTKDFARYPFIVAMTPAEVHPSTAG
jgi:predicted nucleic acid-binding protein